MQTVQLCINIHGMVGIIVCNMEQGQAHAKVSTNAQCWRVGIANMYLSIAHQITRLTRALLDAVQQTDTFLSATFIADSYIKCENKISGEKFHRRKFMLVADKELILGSCKQHPIQFQCPRGSGHISKNVGGLLSTRYIQCHNLVVIKDIHVHHMISSTVLNTLL